MRKLSGIVVLLLMWSSSSTAEQVYVSTPRRTTTVELFTSEGCSSCPPAERWLARLKGHPKLWRDIVPLAFHVDYWDYLGWRDRYASPEYSARQRRYQRQGAIGAVYTPGIVVNGEEYRGFFNPLTRNGELPRDSAEPGILVLTVDEHSARLEFKGEMDGPLIANLAWLGIDVESSIARGENRGRVLSHNFVVLDHLQVRGQGSWELAVPEVPPGADAVAAWLSRPDDQRPIQAVGGDLKARHL